MIVSLGLNDMDNVAFGDGLDKKRTKRKGMVVTNKRD